MHRIDTPTALPGGVFTEGDPVIPIAATEVSADWLNAVQAELVNAIQGAGIALAKADNSQLLAAIRALLPQAATTILAGLVELATSAEVAALTDTVRAVTPAGLAAVLPQAATTALAGLVELATAAEVAALTDASRAVTPAGLAGVLPKTATTALAGLIRLATSTEAQAGTTSGGVVTPATLRAGLNAAGSAPVYACRAWCNFNGTGTVAIRGSGNVSSITDNGTGDYTVNFAIPMPDTNYGLITTGARTGGMLIKLYDAVAAPQTTSVRIMAINTESIYIDNEYVFVAIVR